MTRLDSPPPYDDVFYEALARMDEPDAYDLDMREGRVVTEQTTEAKVRAWLERTLPPPEEISYDERQDDYRTGYMDGLATQHQGNIDVLVPEVAHLVEALGRLVSLAHMAEVDLRGHRIIADQKPFVDRIEEARMALNAVLGLDGQPRA